MGNFSEPSKEDQLETERDLLTGSGVASITANKLLFGSDKAAPDVSPKVIDTNAADAQMLLDMEAGMQARKDIKATIPEAESDEDSLSKWVHTAKIGGGMLKTMLQVNGFWRDSNADDFTHGVTKIRDDISDVMTIGMGLAEPFTRSQQALFSWLSGEGGLEKIVDDMFNPMTIDLKTGEYYIGSRAFASVGAIAAKISQQEDDSTALEELEDMNRLYEENRVQTFMEVVDAWKGGAGPALPGGTVALPGGTASLPMGTRDPTGSKAQAGAMAMDEVYQKMNTGGVLGKIAMGGLSVTYGIGDVIVDPLLIAADAPVIAVNAARRALPAAVRAARTAAVLRRQRTLVHMEEAIEASYIHLQKTLKANKASATIESLQDVKVAAYAHTKLLAEKAKGDVGDFTKITFAGGKKRAPEAVALTRNTPYMAEFSPLSQTRGVSGAERKSKLLADVQKEIDDLLGSHTKVRELGPEAKKTYKKLDKLRKKIRKTPEDKLDELAAVEGSREVPRTVESLAADLEARRMVALGEPSPQVYDGSVQDLPFEDIASRALSQDAGETSGDAFANLVRGATVDDVQMPRITLPSDHLAVSGPMIGVTEDGLIDLPKAQKTINKWHAKVKKARGQKELDLKYDERFLPKKPTAERVRDAMLDLRANAPDMLGAGLYPGGYRWKAPALIKSAWYHIRPAQRTMKATDPGAWELWRNALQGQEIEHIRLENLFQRELTRFGVLKPHKAEPVAKALIIERGLTGPKVDKTLSEKLFTILNTPEEDEYFALLSSLNSPEQQLAVTNLRTVLNRAMDQQGLTGTNKSIAGYINHVLDKKNMRHGTITPEMLGLSPQGKVFVAHLLDRTGKIGFRPDAAAALDVYARATAKKLWLEPALMQLKQRAKLVAKEKGNEWYAGWMDDFIRDMTHQPSFLGSMTDNVLGRITASANVNYKSGDLGRLLSGVSGLSYVSALAGNVKYPIMAISTALNTAAAEFGIFRTMKGMFATARPAGQLLAQQAGITKQFHKIFGDTGFIEVAIKKLAAVRGPLRPSVGDTEAFIRGMTHQAALDHTATKMGFKNVDELLTSRHKNRAIAESVRATEETNHFFGMGSRPPIFAKASRSLARMATLFQSFGPKQTEQALKLSTDNPGYIVRYMMLGGWLQRVAAEELNVDLSEYVGFGYRPSGTDDVTSPGADALVAWVRFAASVTDVMFDEGDPKELSNRANDLQRALETIVPYRVGIQQGMRTADAALTGQRRTDKGALKSDLYMGPGNVPGEPQDILEAFRTRKGAHSELIPALFGMRSMEEKAAREADKRIRRLAREQVFEERALGRAAVNAYHKAVDAGEDTDKRAAAMAVYQEKIQALIDRGVDINPSTNPIEMDIEASIIEGWLRELDLNPKIAEKIIQLRTASGQISIGKVGDEVVK